MIIRTATEKNWEAIQKGAECLSLRIKNVSPYELDGVLEAILERVKKTRFYSIEELESITEKQLEKLTQRMRDINLEDRIINTIIKNLNWQKEYAIKITSEEPIWENQQSNYLPILPVIDEKIIDINTQMKLLDNNGKIGQSLVPLKKIKNYCNSKKGCYWLIDVRMNEPRYNCHFLTISEAIAYAFQNKTYDIKALNSRYKYKKHYPELCISLIDEYPVLCQRNSLPNPHVEIGKPHAALRLVN